VSARPGSALWLLKHEMRLFWYNLALAKGKGAQRRSNRALLAWLGIIFLAVHAGAFALLRLRGIGDMSAYALLAPALTLLFIFVLLIMLSAGLAASVEVLFNRGDLDLLLSSPLESRSIFAVRLAAIVAQIAGTYLLLLAPFANVGLLLGQVRWLGIYPSIIGSAAITGSASILLTLALVRLLGARRTRVVAQVLSAFAGALLFLFSQAYNLVKHGDKQADAQALAAYLPAPDSALWLPGRALLGAPGPLLALSLLAAGSFFLTVRYTHHFFVHGLQQAASTSRVRKARPSGIRMKFRRNLAETVVVKEWRLIARDPHLISQTLLQVLYLLPMIIAVFSDRAARIPAIGAGLSLFSASLGASLTWITVQAEDAPELLRVAPAKAFTIRMAKLAAAVMPPLALVCLPLLWLLARAPLLGLLASFTVVGAVFGATMIVHWIGRPGSRDKFQLRGQRNHLGIFLELGNTIAWAGLAYMLLSGINQEPSATKATVTLSLFLATLVMPLLAFLCRRRDDA
jgi:ABC-2 type transport system permease protein